MASAAADLREDRLSLRSKAGEGRTLDGVRLVGGRRHWRRKGVVDEPGNGIEKRLLRATRLKLAPLLHVDGLPIVLHGRSIGRSEKKAGVQRAASVRRGIARPLGEEP